MTYYPHNIPHGYFRSFKLGGLYSLWTFKNNGTIVKFIKVTRKGFNLLDIETNRCIIEGRHLYCREYGQGIEIPPNVTNFKNVFVPDWISLKEIEEIKK